MVSGTKKLAAVINNAISGRDFIFDFYFWKINCETKTAIAKNSNTKAFGTHL